MISRWKDRILPWLPVMLGPALLFGPALIRGEVLFWGTPLLQFTPWRTFAKMTVADGYLPLWNPLLGMGAPLMANYQSALLYPPNWILLLLDVPWGQTLLVMLHLMIAGSGMVVLCRRLKLGRSAQAFAGLAFGMSGYLVARAGFLSINAASAWLPWIIAAADAVGSRRSLDSTARLSLVLAMQWLAGHAQLSWYTLLLTFAWIAYRSQRDGGWKATARSLAYLSLACIAAFLLAAIQLLPTLEYLSVSSRDIGLDSNLALTYSFWPWRALGLVAPDLFGNPRAGNYWGYGNYWEDAVYVGILPLLLAASAILRRDTPKVKWFLLGTLVIVLVLALGGNTPIFPWLFESVPSFSFFQAPTRWNLLLVFSLALLAGYGAESWRAARGRSLYWVRLGTAGAAAMVVTAAVSGPLLTETEPTFVPAIMLSGVWIAVAGLLALTRREPVRSVWAHAAIGVALLDLLLMGRGLNPTVPTDIHQGASKISASIRGGHRILMAPEIEDSIKYELAFRFDSFQPDFEWRTVREFALPNTGMLDGIRSANNFDPILPARQVAWLANLAAASEPQRTRLLRSADIGWQVGIDGKLQEVANPTRAWIVPQAQWAANSDEARSLIASADFDPFDSVVLEGERLTLSGGSGQVLSLKEHGPNRVEVRTVVPEGGWLVLADSWYPGWSAELDGEPAQHYPANAAFRAIWVPPGDHAVTFAYEPVSVRLGALMTVMGAIGLLAMRRR